MKLRLVLAPLLLLLAISAPLSVWASSGTLTVTEDTSLTEDHYGNIVIAADGATFDCDGHKVIGSGSGVGILLDGRSTVTVENCHVEGFPIGFGLGNSSDNTLKKNTANDNGVDGFRLFNSSNNILEENTARKNGRYGYLDASAGPANTHINNKCKDNVSGGSSPSGLCQPQP